MTKNIETKQKHHNDDIDFLDILEAPLEEELLLNQEFSLDQDLPPSPIIIVINDLEKNIYRYYPRWKSDVSKIYKSWRQSKEVFNIKSNSKRLLDLFDKSFLDYAEQHLVLLVNKKLLSFYPNYSLYQLNLAFLPFVLSFIKNKFFKVFYARRNNKIRKYSIPPRV